MVCEVQDDCDDIDIICFSIYLLLTIFSIWLIQYWSIVAALLAWLINIANINEIGSPESNKSIRIIVLLHMLLQELIIFG